MSCELISIITMCLSSSFCIELKGSHPRLGNINSYGRDTCSQLFAKFEHPKLKDANRQVSREWGCANTQSSLRT